MQGLSILGTGRYVPPLAVTNQMLEGIVDTSDDWIRARTGIAQRAVAAPQETTLSMARTAAERAIAQAGVKKEELAAVVVATITGDYITPSTACLLQRDLGLSEEILAFDLNGACSGFLYALKTAHALLEGQGDKVALVVGSELLSRATDYTDRGTCILFGDGAGAAVIRRGEGTFSFYAGSRGDENALFCRAQYLCNSPFAPRAAERQPCGFFMDGGAVFRFALECASNSVLAVLEREGLAPEEVDHFVFHQANARIIAGIVKRLHIPPERCMVNIGTIGNTSAASVAIALDELNASGRLQRGERVVLSAFGGGLTYGSASFCW